MAHSSLQGTAAIVEVASDRHDRFNSSRPSACEHRSAIFIEFFIVDVGVRIDHGEMSSNDTA